MIVTGGGIAKLREQPQRALLLYGKMLQSEKDILDRFTFAALLKSCAQLKDLLRGSEIHCYICRKGSLLESDDVFLASALVDMYSKCGSVSKAREVFDGLSVTLRNVVSWTALIAAYTESGCSEEAFCCLSGMHRDGVSPDHVTYVCVLKACGMMEGSGGSAKAQVLHADITKKGYETHLVVGSSLVHAYAKCGCLPHAQDVFDTIPTRNHVLWTTLIVGYSEKGHFEEAVDGFKQMQGEGICEDAAMFVCILKACGCLAATEQAQELHVQVMKKGMETDTMVANTLVDVYVKCNMLPEAIEVFRNIQVRTIVSWNAIIGGYLEHGHVVDALRCFKQMRYGVVPPDVLTFAFSLKAYGGIAGGIKEGQDIHTEICWKGLESDTFLGNVLVDMYAKAGYVTEAHQVFGRLLTRDVVSWTSLIMAYSKQGNHLKCLECFHQMHGDGVSPDVVTYVCCAKACGSIGCTAKSQEIHAEIVEKRLEKDIIIGSSLIDMYARCGLVTKAQEVFDKLQVRSAVSWNALITGYAQLGESEQAIHVVNRMIKENIQPNVVTLGAILNACSYTGLIDEGHHYLEFMSKVCNIVPTLEHLNCMVDLLGRAGHIDRALVFIGNMPFHPGAVLWHSLLGACQKWGNVNLGKEVFKYAMELDATDKATYISMLNMYI